MPILSSIIEKDIAIDLGTDTTILYVAGSGIRLREPTVVAMDRQTGRVLKVGEDARRMLGRTPAGLVVERVNGEAAVRFCNRVADAVFGVK